jgi:hypothetical protein
MQEAKGSGQIFQAPPGYVALFYLLLLAWTAGTLPVVYLKFRTVGFQSVWIYASMVGFVYAYTWFWSLGLFYRISLDTEGLVALKSLLCLKRTGELEALLKGIRKANPLIMGVRM